MKIKIEFTEAADGKKVVSDATTEAIQSALDECNGRATSFTITSAQTVIATASRAERYLNAHHVADSDRNGAIATFRPEGPWANAYKNAALSTEITLKRAAGVWSLVAVDRVDVYPRNPDRFRVKITDKASANLVKRMLAAFGRSDLPVAA